MFFTCTPIPLKIKQKGYGYHREVTSTHSQWKNGTCNCVPGPNALTTEEYGISLTWLEGEDEL